MSLVNIDGATKVSPEPPIPPNWNANMESTILSLAPYKLFPIAADTLEYDAVAALLDPVQINAVEQVVNPSLWSRFVNTRKDMLLAKSDDWQLLSKLSTDDRKIIQQMHVTANFSKDAQVAACPYNDNVALLFHCTRDKKNVDTILLQGLDERVGNGGTLGRGIYFAADPYKSMQYDGCGGTIFIFMVLLGDCLSVNPKNIQNFVREPQKQSAQQRNLNDICFDSIVGKPGAAYQCCPIYKINYQHNAAGADAGTSVYSKSRKRLPPFSWTEMPTPSPNSDWPFYAKTIFTRMGVEENAETDAEMVDEIVESAESLDNKLSVLTSLGFTNSVKNFDALEKHSFDLDRTINYLLEQGDTKIDEVELLNNNKLATLMTLGFGDAGLNAEVLKKHSYDLDKCVSELLERFEQVTDAQMDVAGPQVMTPSIGDKSEQSEYEYCLICCDAYEAAAANWKHLQCTHKLCSQCHEQIETTRTTMSGVTETFTKCPFCMETCGVEIGICPNGTMTTSIVPTPCEGYEQCDSIVIQYDIKSQPYQLRRIAYLPNNFEGNELVKLLKIAWDRRICFTIGTSATNGHENVVIWNIHHKTAQSGGIESHGFPDKYIRRCKSELKAFGID